ncbi:peptidoglycan-binding domain-containing protein [Methylobacterium brachythecii]|uniref:Peptidoglycan binding-like domain-containing protein n=1 Tax=Methylobacterium brachythecii TaxID=1176177 RepID=A0A7W6F8N6_9HYPH|nr:peptidoglycan-binding domain-containing protein [Methylobacterium brachythecii]MBB3904595.1 hypothetical protein [Methylobacterium brachythecii]GLS45060.1 hypothetical protein GCM10007884_30490 [Methylobacterium brachythecii]
MARVRNMVDTSVGIRWIYDVEFAVGPGCPNRSDDVQLVQHALNTLSAHYTLKNPNGTLVGYLKRDGIFGTKTKNAIAAYQGVKKAKPVFISTDGQVSPSSATGWTAKGDAQYTIVYLNRDHRDLYGKMMEEADFPEPLKTSIKTKKFVEK